MSDCIWGLVARCDCNGYDTCVFRLSMNSDEGRAIEHDYWQTVEEALEPVWAEYERVRKTRKVDA